MKKHFLLILSLFFTCSFIVSAQSKKTSSTLTKENANKIIMMTNCVVDIYNDQISEINDVKDCLQRFDNSINNILENPNTTVYGASCSNIRSLRNDLVDKLKKNAALAPSFNEKQAILDGIEQLDKEFAISKERCQAIQDYLSSGKYKEDKDLSAYKALRKNYLESYKNINDQFRKTMALASAAGDRAEIVILKSHPLASVIVPMKTNLSAVSQILTKCREDNPNVEEINNAVAAVRKSIEKDKVITPAMKTALAKRRNGEAVFQRFYEYTGDAMDKVDIFVEFLDPNKEVSIDHVLKETEEDARNRHLKQHYDEIQKYYGYMVDAFNTL